MLDGLFGLAHFFEDAGQRIYQFLLFRIKGDFFFDSILQCAVSQVVHAPRHETLTEVARGLETAMQISLRLLQFLNCFADRAGLKVKLPHLETNLQIGFN